MSDLEQYSRYFSAGVKVGVSIPLPNAEVFKDWAIISAIDEDLVTLQLSRDELPAAVTLQYGQILELSAVVEESKYNCRSIIVSEGADRELLLRLIGEIVSDELREFYRIDAFLPIKYYVSREQRIKVLHKQWQSRRVLRQQLERENNNSNWNSTLLTAETVIPQEHVLSIAENGSDEEVTPDAWDTIIPLAANISGGGLRLITHQGFDNGEYVLLEILVPTPRRIVDVIARVIFANHNYAAGTDRDYYNTGIQFVYIDERDRDAIVNHIANIQLKRIRLLREQYLFREGEFARQDSKYSNFQNVRTMLYWTVAVLLFVLVATTLIKYYWRYAQDHPKGEIELIFEDAIKQYKDKYHY